MTEATWFKNVKPGSKTTPWLCTLADGNKLLSHLGSTRQIFFPIDIQNQARWIPSFLIELDFCYGLDSIYSLSTHCFNWLRAVDMLFENIIENLDIIRIKLAMEFDISIKRYIALNSTTTIILKYCPSYFTIKMMKNI